MSIEAENKSGPAMAQEGPLTRFFRATELDTRMLGMVGALVVVWCVFDIWSGIRLANDGLFGGSFLTPRNLWTLLVQTSSIAIMANAKTRRSGRRSRRGSGAPASRGTAAASFCSRCPGS
mgnify:CR=1 FL=1